MRYFKKMIAVVCTILCLMSTSMTAFATEVKPTSEAGAAGTELTFSLTDKTNGICVDNITVTFMNLETTETRPVEIQSANYLLAIPVKGWLPNGSYNILLEYPSKDDYVVKNADGTEITSFSANGTAHTFEWVVESKNGTSGKTENTGAEKESTVEAFAGDTGNKEADALWQAFLKAVAPVETDKKYSSLLKVVTNVSSTYSGLYEKITGNDKQEYLDMSAFQQFLWCSSYILPVNGATASDRDSYTGTLAKWNSNTVGVAYGWLKTYGTQEMTDAYSALMKWDYEYLSSNGGVYNFITGKTSLDNPALVVPPKEDASNHDSDPTQKEIESLMQEEKGAATDDTSKGVWTDTIGLIKGNIVTFIILFILAGAAVGVVIYRKRKNIDDDKE